MRPPNITDDRGAGRETCSERGSFHHSLFRVSQQWRPIHGRPSHSPGGQACFVPVSTSWLLTRCCYAPTGLQCLWCSEFANCAWLTAFANARIKLAVGLVWNAVPSPSAAQQGCAEPALGRGHGTPQPRRRIDRSRLMPYRTPVLRPAGSYTQGMAHCIGRESCSADANARSSQQGCELQRAPGDDLSGPTGQANTSHSSS